MAAAFVIITECCMRCEAADPIALLSRLGPPRQCHLEFSHGYRTPTNAQQAGGDVVTLAEHDDGSTALLVADISAKGIEGTGLARWLATHFAISAAFITRPALILEELNGLFCDAFGDTQGLFAGAFVCRFAPADRRLIYTCAGIERPVLFSTRRPPRYLRYCGVVLGVDDRATYRDEEIAMDRGEMLIAYTDGITESLRRSSAEPLGEDGVLEAIRQSAKKFARPQSDDILTEVDGFNGGLYHDDATLAVIGFDGGRAIAGRTVR
jgi:phosphoserine phosphatase RsbU/P